MVYRACYCSAYMSRLSITLTRQVKTKGSNIMDDYRYSDKSNGSLELVFKTLKPFLEIILFDIFVCLFIVFAVDIKFLHHALIFISFSFFGYALKELVAYKRKRNWLKTHATVMHAAERVWCISGRQIDQYFYPEVVYQYVHANQKHTNSLAFDEFENIRVPITVNEQEVDSVGKRKRWWLGYAAGDAIEVFVNPKQPSQSVLVNTISTQRKVRLTLVFLAGVCTACAWVFLSFAQFAS